MKASQQLLIAAAVLLSGACASGEHLQSSRMARGASPRPTREIPMPTAASIAAARWDSAGSVALRAHIFVQPTFEEILDFPADVPLAVTYRFQMRRGERIDVQVRTQSGEAPYADIFEVIDSAIYRQVHSSNGSSTSFDYTATTDRMHVLRMRPPVGAAGRYAVRVSAPLTQGLVFPVAGVSPSSIIGQWGDARDGGARSHKGLDIFAARGTPVVAVTEGVIATVETTPAGGRVVWQRDERGMMYYYAHLDEQLVEPGERVLPGDPIGLVGNTGNAKGSSPHLHFGLFRPGYVAENPTPYLLSGSSAIVARSRDEPAGVALTSVSVPPRQLGRRVQLTGDRVRLRAGPGEGAPVLDQIRSGTELYVLGSLNGWSRVVMADGKTGFIAAWLLPGEERRSAGTL